jgi:hypothetical protein
VKGKATPGICENVPDDETIESVHEIFDPGLRIHKRRGYEWPERNWLYDCNAIIKDLCEPSFICCESFGTDLA